MLDWGFGRGRSARTGLRLPAPVAPASVDALLTRPPSVVRRHHPADAEALAAAGLAGVRATPARPVAGTRAPWPWRDRQRLAAAIGVAAVLLAAVALAVHRLRQRT
jgi:hypothetical protein